MSKVINISEAASIAFHGIIIIARSDKPTNVIKIAERISSSKHHVAKVMQRLVKQGYLGSVRGPSGGFFLKQAPSELTLLTIYQAIEGDIESGACYMEKPVCTFDKCIYSNIIEKMTCDFIKYLQSQKLSDFL